MVKLNSFCQSTISQKQFIIIISPPVSPLPFLLEKQGFYLSQKDLVSFLQSNLFKYSNLVCLFKPTTLFFVSCTF